MNHRDWIELLPLYAAGRLENQLRLEVENHLSGCQACREELALWQAVRAEIITEDLSLELPPTTAILQGVLARAGGSQSRVGPFRRASQLLAAQFPMVQRELWLASFAVFAIGFCAATLLGRAGLFQALAPLVAVASVATIYGPENDPALELTLATPTSPRQVLLARLALVFGYDLVLALVASLGLLLITPVHLLGDLILGWLAPMAFLSSLALVLSTVIGTRNAMTFALSIWFLDWGAIGLLEGDFNQVVLPAFHLIAVAYTGFFGNPVILLVGAGLLGGIALWLAGRQASSLPRLA